MGGTNDGQFVRASNLLNDQRIRLRRFAIVRRRAWSRASAPEASRRCGGDAERCKRRKQDTKNQLFHNKKTPGNYRWYLIYPKEIFFTTKSPELFQKKHCFLRAGNPSRILRFFHMVIPYVKATNKVSYMIQKCSFLHYIIFRFTNLSKGIALSSANTNGIQLFSHKKKTSARKVFSELASITVQLPIEPSGLNQVCRL